MFSLHLMRRRWCAIQSLAEQLDAIQRRLDQSPVTPAEIEGYEKMLLAEARTAHVEPPDFYGAPRVRIDRLYVAPEIALARHDGEYLSPTTNGERRFGVLLFSATPVPESLR